MNELLYKLAAIQQAQKNNANDMPHREVLDLLKQHHGVVAAHSTGSGKTLLSLKAMQQTGGNTLAITPASLVGNMHKEIAKHNIQVKPDVMSYEAAANRADELAKKHYDLVVLDEAHKIRNPDSSRTRAIRKITESANNRLLLTATPDYNSPRDMNTLVNTAAGKKVLPENQQEFDKKFLKSTLEMPSMREMLHGAYPHMEKTYHVPHKAKRLLRDYVHQYDATKSPEAQKHFPSVEEHDVPVEMSHRQKRVYEYYESQLDPVTRWRVKHGLPVEKRDARRLNTFSSSLRQVSNGTQSFSKHPEKEPVSPKIRTAAEHVHDRYRNDPNFRGVVYSNYLESGVSPYSQELKKRGIPHQILTGSLSKPKRDEMVKKYNNGESPVMLISSAGAEGLDLKGTKLVQIMEPHFNDSKLAQVRGRAARYMSHDHLPQEERHVDIENYISTRRHGGMTIDEYLQGMSHKKKTQSEKTMKIIDRPRKKMEKTAEGMVMSGSNSGMPPSPMSASTMMPSKTSVYGGLAGVALLGGVAPVATTAAKGAASLAAVRGASKAGVASYLKAPSMKRNGKGERELDWGAGARHEGRMAASEFVNGYNGAPMKTNVATHTALGAVAPELGALRREGYYHGQRMRQAVEKGLIKPEHVPFVNGRMDYNNLIPSDPRVKQLMESTQNFMGKISGKPYSQAAGRLRRNSLVNMARGALDQTKKGFKVTKDTTLNRILKSHKGGSYAAAAGGLAPGVVGLASGDLYGAIGGLGESAGQVGTTWGMDHNLPEINIGKRIKSRSENMVKREFKKARKEGPPTGNWEALKRHMKNLGGTFMGSPLATDALQGARDVGALAHGASKIGR